MMRYNKREGNQMQNVWDYIIFRGDNLIYKGLNYNKIHITKIQNSEAPTEAGSKCGSRCGTHLKA